VTIPLSERKGKFAELAFEVRDGMRRGQCLIFEQRQHQIRWYLSSGELIPGNIVGLVLTDPHIVGTGDSLFPGTTPSQAYWWRP
jgi:hypothetical protein